MTAERRMEKLSRRNDFKLYTLTTPIGTKTVNSRQSTTISELSGASEVIICVRTGSATTPDYESHFIAHDGADFYSDYFYQRPQDNDYGILYDVQWIPASNEVNIRSDVIGSKVSASGYPKIYAVMYR